MYVGCFWVVREGHYHGGCIIKKWLGLLSIRLTLVLLNNICTAEEIQRNDEHYLHRSLETSIRDSKPVAIQLHMLEVFTSDKSYYNPTDPARSRKDAAMVTVYLVRNGNYNPQHFLTDCVPPVRWGLLSQDLFSYSSLLLLSWVQLYRGQIALSNGGISVNKTYCAIHRIEIYPVVGIIHASTNQGLKGIIYLSWVGYYLKITSMLTFWNSPFFACAAHV